MQWVEIWDAAGLAAMPGQRPTETSQPPTSAVLGGNPGPGRDAAAPGPGGWRGRAPAQGLAVRAVRTPFGGQHSGGDSCSCFTDRAIASWEGCVHLGGQTSTTAQGLNPTLQSNILCVQRSSAFPNHVLIVLPTLPRVRKKGAFPLHRSLPGSTKPACCPRPVLPGTWRAPLLPPPSPAPRALSSPAMWIPGLETC